MNKDIRDVLKVAELDYENTANVYAIARKKAKKQIGLSSLIAIVLLFLVPDFATVIAIIWAAGLIAGEIVLSDLNAERLQTLTRLQSLVQTVYFRNNLETTDRLIKE